MAHSVDTSVTALRDGFGGDVFTPGDPGYEDARSIWNGAIGRRPAVIARCSSAADVASAIRFARAENLPISVRGGGHNFAGFALCDGGVMIHLGAMNDVRVMPSERRVVCGGGATWADVDAATQAHGLAAPGGIISHTGVGGLTLGGGMGWLLKKAGLSCDNLLSAEVVTADGQIQTASADEHPDLFWALRGGGGNFGVVTRFEYRLHEVGPLVNAGLFFWGLDHGVEALRAIRDFLPTLPESTGSLIVALNAPPAPFVPEQYHFAPCYGVVVAGFGSAEEHARLVAPIREALPPLFELVTPMPFTALQQLFDAAAPWGILAYEKALYLDELTDEVIDIVVEHTPRKQSPLSFIPIFDMGGAYRRVGENDTAFGGSRSAGYVFNITAMADTPELIAAETAWVRAYWEALKPHSSNAGGYVNFMSEYQEDRVRAAYGPQKYDRLADIKARYDPDNIFSLNANIRPTVRV